MSNEAERKQTSVTAKSTSPTPLFTRDNPPPPPPRSTNNSQYSHLCPPPPPPRPTSLNRNLEIFKSRESTSHRQGRLSRSQAYLSVSDRTAQVPSNRSLNLSSGRSGRRVSFNDELLVGNRREKGTSYHNTLSNYCIGNTSSEPCIFGKRNTDIISRSSSGSALSGIMATKQSASNQFILSTSQPSLYVDSKAKDDQEWLEILAAVEGKSTSNNKIPHRGASNEIVNLDPLRNAQPSSITDTTLHEETRNYPTSSSTSLTPMQHGLQSGQRASGETSSPSRNAQLSSVSTDTTVHSPYEKASSNNPTSSFASTSHPKQHEELQDKKSYKERVLEVKNKILSTVRLIQETHAKDARNERSFSKQNFDNNGRCRRHPHIIVAKKRYGITVD